MSRDDKRKLILNATMELLAEKGFHDAPCSLIAERAGVAAGTIYRYFENKDVLINDLYLDIEGRISAILLVGYPSEGSIRDRFMHLGTGILNFFISNPSEFRFVEQFHNSPYGTAFRRDRLLGVQQENDTCRKCEMFKELFTEALEKQVVKQLPLILLFDLAFGPIVSVARNHVLGFIMLDDGLIELMVSACWDGLKR